MDPALATEPALATDPALLNVEAARMSLEVDSAAAVELEVKAVEEEPPTFTLLMVFLTTTSVS